MDRIKFRSDFFSILQFRHLGNMFHIRKFESAYKPVLRDRGELQLVLPACRVDLWCWGSFQTVVVSERDFSVNDGKVTLQLAHHNGTYTHFIVDGKKLPIRYGLVENITIRILSPGDYTGWGKEEFFPYGRTSQNIPPQYSGSLMEQQSQLRSDVLDESNRREVPINEEVRAHIHGWGGQLEQYLIERRFDININVFDRRRQAWIDRRDPPCISLIFNGSHYNWLERREVPRTPAIVDHTGSLQIHPFLSDLGVRYYESFLPPKLNESISKFIVEQEKFKRAFFASNFSSFSKRDNVKKFVLTYFRKNEDPHSEIITAGTGFRNVYDWTQTPECYGTPYVRNICEFPQAVEFIGFLNERFKDKLNGNKFNSLYFIYYREGVLGKGKNKSMGDFINPHHDKDATFRKDAPFVLYNHLSEGEPRRFAFLEKDDLIEEFAMKDNDALFVSAEANRAVKHALKQELDWKGFRASIVARCISDHIVVKPSESRTVEYNGRTPTDIQRNPIEYSVRINGKYTHAAELIQQREQRDMFLFQAKSFSESGQTKELEVLLNSTTAKLIYTKDYSYAYRRFVCRMNAAKTPNELEDAFLWFESLGKKFTKAIKKDWEEYKRKKRKKYKF